MKAKFVFPAILGLALALFSVAQEAAKTTPTQQKPAHEKPIAPLGWLVGGVWKADATKLAPGMQRIETRYEWSDNGAYLHFTTHFVFEKGTLKNYDGNFYWDPEKKSLAIWYMDPKNNITHGPVEWSNDLMRVTFHGPDFEGNDADLKVDVTRKSNDQYHWAVFEKVDNDWKELGSLEYMRDPAAAAN